MTDEMLSKIKVLVGTNIFITGATGLIGSTLVKEILDYNITAKEKINMILLVRDINKAKSIFSFYDTSNVTYIVGNIIDYSPVYMHIDYIIHGAGKTSSRSFVNEPVETVLTAFDGTKNMLELARINQVKGFVYLSSMEVYGAPETNEQIMENHSTNIDTMKVRSCYPESKRICECLCTSYAEEYGINIMVLRLAQTFGPGVNYDDERIFAEFARCVIEKRNIILHTKGETRRSYLHVEDAVSAIIIVLLKGKSGEAYNAANEQTYCTIYDMAYMVSLECANGEIEVNIREKDITQLGYAPVLKMNLNTEKLRELGWIPSKSLIEMYKDMIEYMYRLKEICTCDS